MFRKINNKSLLIIFGILAILVIIVVVYDQHKGERTFKSELFKVDSAAVSSITIYAKGNSNEFVKLSKSGKQWDIQSKSKHYPADTSSIKNLLHTLANLKPERVSGTDRSSWKSFEMTDSLSSRVVVEQGNNVTADFRVGKLSFSQRGGQNYGNRNNMEVKSHIRVAGDDKVYVVDGFLSMEFTANPSQYRNKLVFKMDKSNITKLSFSYPGDSSFVLARSGNKWTINNQPSDSTATEKYLNSLSNSMGNEFADESLLFPAYNYILNLEGNNMPTVEIKGFIENASKKYYVNSSLNPSSIFSSSSPNLFNQIFPGKKKFIR